MTEIIESLLKMICDFRGLPEFLYKYYTWESQFDEFRLNGGVYFPSPRKFNDILDCNLPIDFNLDVDKSRRNHYIYKIEELFPGKGETLYDAICSGDKETIERIYIEQQNKLGVLCLSIECENPMLWAYYAKNDGFCIKYNTKTLVESIKCNFAEILNNEGKTEWIPEKRVKIGKVKYTNNIHISKKLFLDDRDSDALEKYWTKSKHWKCEHEFRIGVSLGGNMEIADTGSVEEIILGCNPTLDRYIRCLDLLEDKNIKLSVFHSKKHSLLKEPANSIWPSDEIKQLFRECEPKEH